MVKLSRAPWCEENYFFLCPIKMSGKICNTCYEFKTYKSFRKEKTCCDGFRGKCKDCERPMKQKHYQNNKEKYKQAFQEFMVRNPDYFRKYKNLTKNGS